MTTAVSSDALVTGVNGNIVSISAEGLQITKNEIGYVCTGEDRLKAEVLRVEGHLADLQVYEETAGVRVGDRVELTGQLLSATFGPGCSAPSTTGCKTFASPCRERWIFPQARPIR